MSWRRTNGSAERKSWPRQRMCSTGLDGTARAMGARTRRPRCRLPAPSVPA